jgi:hypothetical protein
MPKVQHQVRITGNVVKIVEYEPPRRGRPANHPVTTYRVHPLALEAALELADGDKTRLRPQQDGTIYVENRGKD